MPNIVAYSLGARRGFESGSVLEMHWGTASNPAHQDKLLFTLKKLNLKPTKQLILVSLKEKKAIIGNVVRLGSFADDSVVPNEEVYKPLSQFDLEQEKTDNYVWVELDAVKKLDWAYIEKSISSTGKFLIDSLNGGRPDIEVKTLKKSE